MPTYRGIVVTLRSQFDVELLPEFPPRLQQVYTDRGITKTVPPLFDEKTSTCSVYVPVFPGSQFWIGYSVCPPVPEDQQFLFKLFINGAHIVSWSTGKEEGWKGKTMFGLYEIKDEDGNRRVEKRMLCFTTPDGKNGQQWTDVTDAFDEKAVMEIRVYRAHGRKRVEREVEEYDETEYGKNQRGIHLVNAGRAGAEQPKRFYKFALIDPTDQPFATFRYYYRTWDQIRELLLLEEEYPESETVLSVIEPGDVQDASTNSLTVECGYAETSPRVYVPKGAPHKGGALVSDENASQFYKNRLSVPPSLKLNPVDYSSRPLPSIPKKNEPVSDTTYQPHPIYPMEDWVRRTPSPVKSIRDGISTPPLIKRKGLTATGLMNVIVTTWKRRGTPTPDDDGSRAASRGSWTASRNASRNG